MTAVFVDKKSHKSKQFNSFVKHGHQKQKKQTNTKQTQKAAKEVLEPSVLKSGMDGANFRPDFGFYLAVNTKENTMDWGNNNNNRKHKRRESSA